MVLPELSFSYKILSKIDMYIEREQNGMGFAYAWVKLLKIDSSRLKGVTPKRNQS